MRRPTTSWQVVAVMCSVGPLTLIGLISCVQLSKSTEKRVAIPKGCTAFVHETKPDAHTGAPVVKQTIIACRDHYRTGVINDGQTLLFTPLTPEK